MSKTFVALLALLALFAYSVDAHGWMSYPTPRGQFNNPPKRSDEEYAQATKDVNDPALVCRNDPVMPKDKWISLNAGTAQSITLSFSTPHPGDCFVYLSYDGDKPDSQKQWFKIWQQHDCYEQSNYNIQIPSYLPSGDHVVFRWEWYALHRFDAPIPEVEYYVQCVDAKLTGSPTGTLPQPQFHIPGHLPAPYGSFVEGNNNYYSFYNGQTEFFTGPPLSTNGQPNPTTPTQPPQTSATARPTSAPAPTPKPKPTQKPVTIPTQQPTRPPVVVPTTKPTGPTTSPSESVKLVVSESSSVWWIAVSVTGHRHDEVAKVELKDSSVGSVFRQMENAWGDSYTLNAGDAPLVLPFTVKASLPSGSSLSFIVNRLPSIIDSGSVFP